MERKLIAAAVSSALALPMAAQAVEFSAYGQVTRAIISVDGAGDDTDGDLQHVEGAASPSRFGFRGSEELESGMTVGVNAEWSADPVSTRQAHLYLSTAGGKLTVGHGSTAADGMAHADLSGGPSFLGGATPYCAWAGEGVACPTNDGTRASVLRYDTPAIGPASIAISTGNDDYWDVKLTLSGSMGDAGYNLRIGHIGEHDEGGDVTTASAASSFGQGTSVALAWSQDNNADNEYQYVKLDHSYADGASVAVYYKAGQTGATDGSMVGVALGHTIGGGATAFAGYRRLSEDNAEDVDLIVAGLRVAFN